MIGNIRPTLKATLQNECNFSNSITLLTYNKSNIIGNIQDMLIEKEMISPRFVLNTRNKS